MRNYLSCVKGVDESVATLMKTLEELGLSENTIVIYSADQGFYLGDRGWYDKRWMYEPSLEMPLIVKWPGVVTARVRATTISSRISTTLRPSSTWPVRRSLTICRASSLVPLLKGEKPAEWRDAIYYHYFEYPSVHMVARHRGVRTDRFKLIHFYQFDEWEFYDFDADPQEQRSQYDNPVYAAEVAKLKERLEPCAYNTATTATSPRCRRSGG
jgi:arylsulfatase A-like enzyme